MKKTDLRNEGSVMNIDENLSNVANTLTKDETVQETNPDEDSEMPKLTVLDNHEQMMRRREKELNSLKEIGAMTVVKKSEPVGKRAIQTRWVDRERRPSEIQAGLEGLQSMSRAHTARDVFINTVDVVSENDAGCELT